MSSRAADEDVTIVRAIEADPDATVVRSPGRAEVRRGRPDPAPPIAEPEPPLASLASASLRGGPARVYGTRAVSDPAPLAPDEVQRRIGQPPAAAPRPAGDRSPLPSLAKRFKRERVITLACYAGAVALSAAGLTVIARLAFA